MIELYSQLLQTVMPLAFVQVVQILGPFFS
jgi:hypothetical protein